MAKPRIKALLADLIEIDAAEPSAEPVDPEAQVNESHIELRLGFEAFVTKEKTPVRLSPKSPYLTIPSGEFALLTTHEIVKIPTNVLGLISIKFQYKILGLVNVSGFHVDPGYAGKIVFSVFNLGPSDIVLRYLDPIFLLFLSFITDAVSDARKTGKEHFKNLRGLPLESVVTLKGSGLSLTTMDLGGQLKTGQSWTPETRPVGAAPQARVFYRSRV